MLEAAKAALPPDLLAQLAHADGGRGPARAAGRAGQVKISVKRGRPVGTRQGEPRNGARLHLLETLKAAAPWQKLRGAERTGSRSGATISALSASASASAPRRCSPSMPPDPPPCIGLAEAKGAVELLLADCYVRRDQVALIAFRGHGATLLLPPTGSLLRAKRSLAGLPGGGPTPLAAGIEAAMALADTDPSRRAYPGDHPADRCAGQYRPRRHRRPSACRGRGDGRRASRPGLRHRDAAGRYLAAAQSVRPPAGRRNARALCRRCPMPMPPPCPGRCGPPRGMRPACVTQRLNWERDGRDWPNRASSRFVDAGGLRWHVQVMGEGPVVLLIHGTGASTHSFRALAPLLAPHFTVVVPDLPGHGFTDAPPSASGYSLARGGART